MVFEYGVGLWFVFCMSLNFSFIDCMFVIFCGVCKKISFGKICCCFFSCRIKVWVDIDVVD